jgi:hypothetical protein
MASKRTKEKQTSETNKTTRAPVHEPLYTSAVASQTSCPLQPLVQAQGVPDAPAGQVASTHWPP